MSDETPSPRFREHLRDLRTALAGIGQDVRTDVADAPHVVKEGTKGALARAAGVKRTPLHEWEEPAGERHG